jgi:hypothetical protein
VGARGVPGKHVVEAHRSSLNMLHMGTLCLRSMAAWWLTLCQSTNTLARGGNQAES